MFCTPQAPTAFVNHVVPFQHTDTNRDTDFRRKVTPEIGVTSQNSWLPAYNHYQSPKLTLRQLRDKLPNSFNINHKLFQIYKEDGTTTHSGLCDRHTYKLNAKFNKKTFKRKQKRVTWSPHEKPMQNYATFRSPACTATLAQRFLLLLYPLGQCPISLPSTWPHKPAHKFKSYVTKPQPQSSNSKINVE